MYSICSVVGSSPSISLSQIPSNVAGSKQKAQCVVCSSHIPVIACSPREMTTEVEACRGATPLNLRPQIWSQQARIAFSIAAKFSPRGSGLPFVEATWVVLGFCDFGGIRLLLECYRNQSTWAPGNGQTQFVIRLKDSKAPYERASPVVTRTILTNQLGCSHGLAHEQ